MHCPSPRHRLLPSLSWIGGLLVALLLAGCGGGGEESEGLSGSLRIDGSSTVYPLSEAVAEEFLRANPNVSVTVGESGTGGGFSKFLRKETAINDASRPITETEREQVAPAVIGRGDGERRIRHDDQAFRR